MQASPVFLSLRVRVETPLPQYFLAVEKRISLPPEIFLAFWGLLFFPHLCFLIKSKTILCKGKRSQIGKEGNRLSPLGFGNVS